VLSAAGAPRWRVENARAGSVQITAALAGGVGRGTLGDPKVTRPPAEALTA